MRNSLRKSYCIMYTKSTIDETKSQETYARSIIAYMRDGSYTSYNETQAGPYSGVLALIISGCDGIVEPKRVEENITNILKTHPNYKNILSKEVQPPCFTLYDDDHFENLPARNWLIPGILPEKGVIIVYGPPGSGKSLLTMQWGMHIARGIGWCGKKVTQGSVIYVAAEGATGIRQRTKAWKTEMHVTGNSGVKWIDKAVLLNHDPTVDEFIAAIKAQLQDVTPTLIVFDTLSRCTPGSDENSNKEMGVVIGAADKIRETFDCGVMIVHHDGKEGGTKGARGAQTLMGNVETAIQVSPTIHGCKVSCYKMKDGPKFDDMHFAIKQYTFDFLNLNDTGAVLVPTEKPIAEEKLTPSQEKVLDILGDRWLADSEWETLCIDAGVAESTFKAAKKVLKDRNVIIQQGKKWGNAKNTSTLLDEKG